MRTLAIIAILLTIAARGLVQPSREAPSVGPETAAAAKPIVSSTPHMMRASSHEEAAAWAQRIEDPILREQTVAEVAIAWADENPKAAADFLLSFSAPGQTQNNAAIGIVQRLASKDPDKAAAWAEKFPDELRERAFEQIARVRERAATQP